MPSWTVLPEEEGLRLDHALERLMPNTGLRGRRRACASGMVTVNGRQAAASFKVRAGDMVALASPHGIPLCSASAALPFQKQGFPGENGVPADQPRLLQASPHLAFLYKPAGLHSVSLAGRPELSLEAQLPRLLSTLEGRLLSRLDYFTSGIVTAALDSQGEAFYRAEEDACRIEKRYLALLEGEVSKEVLATMPLDASGLKRVRVLPGHQPDTRRHTSVTPLALLESSRVMQALQLSLSWQGQMPPFLTLAGCVIVKGTRHQIRAHCSALGFPLFGDRRYGASLHPPHNVQEQYFLHHGALRFSETGIQIAPPWLDSMEKSTARRALDWLGGSA